MDPNEVTYQFLSGQFEEVQISLVEITYHESKRQKRWRVDELRSELPDAF